MAMPKAIDWVKRKVSMNQGLVRQHAAGNHRHAMDVMALCSMQHAVAVQAIDVPSHDFGITLCDLLNALAPAFRSQFEMLGTEFRDH